MTWTCLCARYGKEAMLADVNPYYILGSVCACVWMIMLCVSVWSSCVCVCVCVCVWLVVCVCVWLVVCVCVCVFRQQATGHRHRPQAQAAPCSALLCSALLWPDLLKTFLWKLIASKPPWKGLSPINSGSFIGLSCDEAILGVFQKSGLGEKKKFAARS